MTLMNLQKEIVSMIAKCGSETIVVRTDCQSWIRDIKCLKHANIDGREMVIIDWGGIDMDLAICFVAFVLIGIMVSIDNIAKELSKIRKILEENEE